MIDELASGIAKLSQEGLARCDGCGTIVRADTLVKVTDPYFEKEEFFCPECAEGE